MYREETIASGIPDFSQTSTDSLFEPRIVGQLVLKRLRANEYALTTYIPSGH